MAITHVGTAANSAPDGNDVTVTLPAMQQNDVVYVTTCTNDRGGDSGIPQTAGYSQIASVNTGANGAKRVFRKFMGATPDSTVVVNGTGNAADSLAVVVDVERGVDLTTPEDATPTTAIDTFDGPAITTVTDGAVVLSIVGSAWVPGTSYSPPASYTDAISVAQTDTNRASCACARREIPTAGTEDPGAWAGPTDVNPDAITVALRPASGDQSVNLALLTETDSVLQLQQDWSVWSTQIDLEIDPSYVDAALTDFPVYVPLDRMGAAFWAAVRSDGGDVRATSVDEVTEYPIHVARFDNTNQNGDFYVKLPSIAASGASPTQFRVHVGNAAATTPAVGAANGRNAVWSSYLHVWLLNESALNLADATGTLDLTVSNGTPDFQQDIIENRVGVNLTRADNEYVGTADTNEFASGTALSVEVVARNDSGAASETHDIASHWNFTTSNRTWLLTHHNTNQYFWEIQGGTNISGGTTDSRRRHVVGRLHATNGMALMVDGIVRATAVNTPTLASTTGVGVRIGNQDDDGASLAYDGKIDEVLIATSDLGQAWFRARYINLFEPDNFVRPVPAVSATNSFFDHFDELLSARWGTSTTGAGSASASDSILTLTTGAASGDAAIAWLKDPVLTTSNQLQVVAYRPDGSVPSWAVHWIDKSTAPAIEGQSAFDARRRLAAEFNQGTTGLRLIYWASGHTATYWDGSTWTTTASDAQNAEEDEYYYVGFEVDADGSQVRFLVWQERSAALDVNFSMRLMTVTDWVALSSIETITNDLWLVLGDPRNDTVANQSGLFEFSGRFVGAKKHAFVNRSFGTTVDAYHIAHYWLHDHDYPWAVPQDAGTVVPSTHTLDVGAAAEWDDNYVKDQCVVYDGTTYVLFYKGHDGTSAAIGVATSSDVNAKNWTKFVSNPAISPPAGYTDLEFPFVLRDDAAAASERWKMYMGAINTAGDWEILYSTLSESDWDAGNWGSWTTPAQAFTGGASGGWDDGGVTQPVVVEVAASNFLMFYAGHDGGAPGVWNTGVASATGHGTTWTDQNPNGEAILARRNERTTANGAMTATSLDLGASLSTMFYKDDPIAIDDDTPVFARVRKLTDADTLELQQHVPGVTLGLNVEPMSSSSVAVRDVVANGEGWLMAATLFRFNGVTGDEGAGVFACRSADPVNAQWSLRRPFSPFPYSHGDGATRSRSLENLHFMRDFSAVPIYDQTAFRFYENDGTGL